MTYFSDSDKINVAYYLAARAHEGQTDKSGKEYINHPLRVESKFKTADYKIVAILHDTIEDTFITKELIETLFGSQIALAVDLLSRRADESYMKFINRMCVTDFSIDSPGVSPWMERSYQMARLVKIADLEDNMDLSRLQQITDEDLNRIKKYEKARQRLLEIEKEHIGCF